MGRSRGGRSGGVGLRYHCTWSFKLLDQYGRVVWRYEKNNLLATEGGKSILDTFFRNTYTPYFPVTDFYVGLYRGSVSKATTLATIPGEPVGYGYARVLCERSTVGFPTIELDDEGDWRVVSKEMTFAATGGDIGPIDGGFIGTSSTAVGTLIGVVSVPVQRTILAGMQMIVQIKVKIS
jgi:hypothetical protein